MTQKGNDMDLPMLANALAPVTVCATPACVMARDAKVVADLDLAFQAAVKRNDTAAIDAILHRDFCMVLGDGRVVSRDDVLNEARGGQVRYDIQDEDPGTQSVRVWGDTAVVTARLRIKGTGPKGPFDRRLWFSDTYVRGSMGWRYAFAQVSLPLGRPEPLATQEPSLQTGGASQH
jgi:ketosteroid isomerase-like protein